MDLRTLFLAQTYAMVTMAALLWLARSEADHGNGLRLWTAGVTSQGLAFLMLANAGHLPLMLSAVLGNAAGALSVALFFAAIRQHLDLGYQRPWLVAMVLAVTGVAGLAGEHYAGATIFNGYIYGLIQLLNAAALWRAPPTALAALNRIRRVVALFYLLMGLVLPLRATALLLSGSTLDYLDLPAGWQGPLYIFGFVFIIVTNLGFLLICKMRAEAEVRHQALTDELTGLPNRRALDEAVAQALAAARPDGPPFVVVMIDVDHFKAINDRFGHHTGDLALSAFARRLKTGLRPQDQGFRYGGEEFCALLPATDADTALRQAEQLREAVALPAAELMQARSASFGLAVWRPGDTADALFGRADGALYRAKSLGRNRVELG